MPDRSLECGERGRLGPSKRLKSLCEELPEGRSMLKEFWSAKFLVAAEVTAQTLSLGGGGCHGSLHIPHPDISVPTVKRRPRGYK